MEIILTLWLSLVKVLATSVLGLENRLLEGSFIGMFIGMFIKGHIVAGGNQALMGMIVGF